MTSVLSPSIAYSIGLSDTTTEVATKEPTEHKKYSTLRQIQGETAQEPGQETTQDLGKKTTQEPGQEKTQELGLKTTDGRVRPTTIDIHVKATTENKRGRPTTIELVKETTTQITPSPITEPCAKSTLSIVDMHLLSPNFPEPYGDYMCCSRRITAPNGLRVRLTFISFSLEEESTCDYDYVEIFDGDSPRSQSLTGRLCGKINETIEVTSSAENLFLIFITDYSVVENGFQALVQYI
ncbi:uncharacterized protein [Apostichopus japonicus]|uniref:uncharacterized protein n=1 Tax=Stichopus japonicus TaxID=307972 RepID=UPI003AB38226